MFRWLKGYLRLGGWKYRAAAQKKQELNPQAQALGMSLMDALLNRKNICKRCHAIYTPTEHEFAQVFAVRSILRVQDSIPDPMLCDFCFSSVLEEVNKQMTNIGTSNSGPPNLILRRSVEKT